MKGFRLWAVLGALLTVVACGDGSVKSPDFVSELKTLTISPDPTCKAVVGNCIPAGRSVQFSLAGTKSTVDNGSVPVSDLEGEWKIENVVTGGTTDTKEYAIVDNKTGYVTAKIPTPSTVKVKLIATVGGITAEKTFMVGLPEAESIIITDPADPTHAPLSTKTIGLGANQTFAAYGVYSDGSKEAIDAVTWTLAANTILERAPATGNTTTVSPTATPGKGTVRLTAATAAGVFTELAQTAFVDVTVGDAVIDPTKGFTMACNPKPIIAPSSTDCDAIATFTDRSRQNIDGQVDYTATPTTVADFATTNFRATGFLTSKTAGTVTVTATLKAGAVPGITGTDRIKTDTVSVLAEGSTCLSPLLDSSGYKITPGVSGSLLGTPLCLGCSVTNEGRIIDAITDNFGTLNVLAGLLDSGPQVSITPKGTGTLYPAGSTVSFEVSRPAGPLLAAEVLSAVKLSTLLGTNVQETAGDTTASRALRVDLLGTSLIGGQPVTKALVSFTATLPFDGVSLALVGTVNALTELRVYSGCAQTVTPPLSSPITALTGVNPNSATVEIGKSISFTASGSFANGSIGPVPNSFVNWTSSSTTVTDANSATGYFVGKAAGDTTITATLNATAPASATPRSSTAALKVITGVCTTRLQASEGATVTHASGGLCIPAGSVANDANLIDANTSNFATMTLPICLLGGSTQLEVQAAASAPNFTGTNRPGFVIGAPTGTVALVQLLGGYQVQTLNAAGAVVQSSSAADTMIPLRLDLLGTEVINMSPTGLVSFTATLPFHGVRFIANGGLATVLAQTYVYSACANTTP